jgi:hypothetical protein
MTYVGSISYNIGCRLGQRFLVGELNLAVLPDQILFFCIELYTTITYSDIIYNAHLSCDLWILQIEKYAFWL